MAGYMDFGGYMGCTCGYMAGYMDFGGYMGCLLGC